MVVGPDAATCALVAAAVAPLAGGDPALDLSLTMAMTALAGLFCIGASFLRLGAVADFRSIPNLVGFLNGISLHILVGQFGKLLGFPIAAKGSTPKLLEVAQKIGQNHWPTLAATYVVSKRLLPRLPAPLVALVGSGLVVALLGLDAHGVAVVGAVPAGLPVFKLPSFSFDQLEAVASAAAGLALITFTSMVLTARSFAAKNHYEIDADREMAALGAVNIAAALSQGFAISGADSRTAMADASGGRTQVTGLVAAAVIAVVLLFLTAPLRFIPMAGLGAVLIMASLSLLDVQTVRHFYRLNRFEFALSLVATVGVIWVGAVDAIGVAVVLALLHFIRLTARPRAEVLGALEGQPGFHSVARQPTVPTPAGLLLFRFKAPLVFFNAPHFKQQAQADIDAAGPDLKWFVIDAMPVTQVDITAYGVLEELAQTLRVRGAALMLSGRMTEGSELLKAWGIGKSLVFDRHFPTLEQAVEDYRAMRAAERATGGTG